MKTPEEKRTPGQQLLAAQIISINVDPDAAANQVTSYRRMMKVSDADDEARRKLVQQIEELQKRLPPPLPVAEGVRDGDYRLTPDGPGDEPLPGKGTRFEYGVKCCFLPEPGRAFEVPPVYFAANGMDVATTRNRLVVQPGYLKVLTGEYAAAHHASARQRLLDQWAPPCAGGVDCVTRQPLDRARDGESDLAVALRAGHRAHAE